MLAMVKEMVREVAICLKAILILKLEVGQLARI